MNGAADRALLDAMAALERALARTGQPHMLIGGLAVIIRGVPRDTHDIDATIWAPDLDLQDLVQSLADEEIVGRIPDLVQFAQRAQVLLLVHRPSKTPIEVTLAWLPFEKDALDRAERTKLGAVELPVAIAEDLVIYKAVAGRDRDRDDLARLLRLHANQIDLDRVRDLVAQFAEALDEPRRLDDLERIISDLEDG